jgi:hypothetical protein
MCFVFVGLFKLGKLRIASLFLEATAQASLATVGSTRAAAAHHEIVHVL